MKYSGGITIYDEESNTVFDRELTQDEIIEALLAANAKPKVEQSVAVDTSTKEKKVKVSAATPPVGKGQKVCKECGTPGHMRKTCPERRGVTQPDAPAIEASAAAEHEFNGTRDGELNGIDFLKVKDMQRADKPSMVIASAIKRNIREVSKAMDAFTHSEYLELRKL